MQVEDGGHDSEPVMSAFVQCCLKCLPDQIHIEHQS